jgi:hypothetical protein
LCPRKKHVSHLISAARLACSIFMASWKTGWRSRAFLPWQYLGVELYQNPLTPIPLIRHQGWVAWGDLWRVASGILWLLSLSWEFPQTTRMSTPPHDRCRLCKKVLDEQLFPSDHAYLVGSSFLRLLATSGKGVWGEGVFNQSINQSINWSINQSINQLCPTLSRDHARQKQLRQRHVGGRT